MTLAVASPPKIVARPVLLVTPRTQSAVPRRRAPRPFTLAHFRDWASDLILDTGQSWHLEDFQEWFVSDLFRGIPENWWLLPEGNTKTTTLAGVALYHAEHRQFASVPVAAASREQAEILYRQAEGFVLRSERLNAPIHSAIQAAKGKRKTDVPRFVCLEGYRRINHHAGGRIQIFAADDRTGDGVIPTLGLIDEPHRLRDLSLYRTWAGKIAKRGGQIGTISTRGEPGSDFEETLALIRGGAVQVRRRGAFTRYASPRIILHEWAVPEDADVHDMRQVKAANPFSGITREMLAEKHSSPTMTSHHWLRFVCNRPDRDDDVWLGPDGDRLWRDAEEAYTFVPNERTWIGLDLAIKRDTSAAVVMQRRPDGRYHARLRVWVPTEGRPIDLTDVMQFVRDQAKTYNVETVSFDPRFFDVPAKLLADEGFPMAEVPQSVEHMSPAYGSLYEAIHRGQITHEADSVFTSQVLSAVPRFSERGFMLDKGKSRTKIDAAVALALAYDQALRHELPEPSVYLERGFREL
jgi:phage terminase large subunit-like protein